MSRERRIAEKSPAPALGKPLPHEKDAAYSSRGKWDKNEFIFNSEEDEALWRREAYRQSVNHEGWQRQKPVDDQLQATFDSMPELAEGRYFRGADGRHRPIGREQREAPEVERIRRRAFTEFASTGITWNELGDYPADKPHPGEEAAIAFAQAEPKASYAAASRAGPNKMQNMGALPEKPPMMLHPASDIGLNLGDAQESWTGYSKDTGSAPVLVTNNGRINPSALPATAAPMPKYVQTGRPTPSFERRHAFAEGLVARPANDNVRSSPTSGVVSPASGRSLDSNTGARLSGSSSTGTGSAMQREPDPEFAVANPLFNWRRDGEQPPSPATFAVYTVSDEGRFTYLEDKKDEWSQQLASNPEAIFRDMTAEVEKLSVAAQQNFHLSYHRPANQAEIAEINDAVERIVFAPAERWSDSGKSPNHRGLGNETKPYFVLPEPQVISGTKLADAFEEASAVLAQESATKSGGRPGGVESREAAAKIAKKLGDAIRACGGKVTAEWYGSSEPQVQYVKRQVKKSRYPDVGVPFEINGRAVSPIVTHYSAKADGVTMVPRERDQLSGLVVNLARAIYQGDLGIDAVGIGEIPKKRKGQSQAEYEKMMDDLVEKMIDCRRPFLIRLDVDPLDLEHEENGELSKQPER